MSAVSAGSSVQVSHGARLIGPIVLYYGMNNKLTFVEQDSGQHHFVQVDEGLLHGARSAEQRVREGIHVQSVATERRS